MKEIRRLTKVVGAFPNGHSALIAMHGSLEAHCRNPLGFKTISDHGSAPQAGTGVENGIRRKLTEWGHCTKNSEKFLTLPFKRNYRDIQVTSY